MKSSLRRRRYRRIIGPGNYFDEVVASIKGVLSERQLQKLTIIDEDDTYDLMDQMLLRCIDNRCWLMARKEKVLAEVEKFLQKYEFILGSNLDPERIRHIWMTALMNVISCGHGVFFSWWDSWHEGYWIWQDIWKYRRLPALVGFKYWRVFRKSLRDICGLMDWRYWSVPEQEIVMNPVTFYGGRNLRRSLSHQLCISYSWVVWRAVKWGKMDEKRLQEEFMNRSKWHMENLTQCSSIFVNKYKEEVHRAMSGSLGLDTDRSYFLFFGLLKGAKREEHRNKMDFSDFIAGCFSSDELRVLELKDSRGNVWSFRDQIKDRFYSRYPSFVDPKEIMEHAAEKIEEYRILLSSDTAEAIRDTLLDELDRECFVSEYTHLWNLEMDRHLRGRELGCPKRVEAAIDVLMSMIPDVAAKRLEISVEGLVFGLRQQLMARWRRAWLGCSLRAFREYLSQLHIHTPYGFKNWESREKISRIDLQALLEELDMFFLYPQRGRWIRKMLSRLDTGREVGLEQMRRIKMSQMGFPITGVYYKYVSFWFLLFLYLTVFLSDISG